MRGRSHTRTSPSGEVADTNTRQLDVSGNFVVFFPSRRQLDEVTLLGYSLPGSPNLLRFPRASEEMLVLVIVILCLLCALSMSVLVGKCMLHQELIAAYRGLRMRYRAQEVSTEQTRSSQEATGELPCRTGKPRDSCIVEIPTQV